MGTYTKEQLETELTRIKNAVASCRTAIYDKGVTSIPDNVTLAELTSYVNMIECSHPDILLRWIGTGDGDINTISDVYFDTGLLPSYDISFDTMCLKPTTDNNVLFGAYNNDTQSFYFIPNYSTYAFQFVNRLRGYSFRSGSTLSNISTNFYHFSSTNTVEYDAYYRVHAGSNSYTTSSGSSTTSLTSGNTIHIWARNNGTSVDYKATYGSKLKYLCFFKGGDLVRFYVPVLHWNNGKYVPCLYDKVNDVYSYNIGTGTPNYESTGAYLLDYYYVNASVGGAGFLTTSLIYQTMRLYTKFVSYGTSNINEQSVFTHRHEGPNKYGIYSNATGGVSGTQKLGALYRISAGVTALKGPILTEGSEYKVSFFSNVINGSKMFVNDTEYNASTCQTSEATTIGKPLYILGNQVVEKNGRCYYAIANDITRNTTEFWVPVYDKNDSNPIKYVDVRSEAVARYTGNTAKLGYQLLE